MAKRVKPPGKWRGPRKDILSASGQKAYDAAVERNRKAGVSRQEIYEQGVKKVTADKFRNRAMQTKYAPASMAARKVEMERQRAQSRLDLLRQTLAQDAVIKRGWGL